MGTPYLAEIRIVSFNFAPRGWALCNGQLLPINQNQALFSLLGTTYGGDGRVNFALPNLQGRVPIHWGDAHTLGERAGEQTHTVSLQEMPMHAHAAQGTSADPTIVVPTGNVLASAPSKIFTLPGSLTPLHPSSVTSVGGSQAHLNMQPFLILNFCIALQGIFPSPN